MKNILFILAFLFSPLAMADDLEIYLKPTFHLGLGVEADTGVNASSYGVLSLKAYPVSLGTPMSGLRLIGLGVSVNSNEKVGVLFSPVNYYFGRIGISPDFIFHSDRTNFGASVTYNF